MKRAAYGVLVLALLVGSFLGGAWYKGPATGSNANNQGDREILYYVDPMNPAHTSDKPGAAPCGMAMEPVFADDGGVDGLARSLPPGAARITPEIRQIMGIRLEEVEMSAREHPLRTLGRVTPDENLTYRIIAGDEGWVWEVHESTTGSLVKKDQLMASVYNYQFLIREQQFIYALDFEGRKEKIREQAARALETGSRMAIGSIPEGQMEQTVPTIASAMNSPAEKVYYVHDQVEVAKLELLKLGAGEKQLNDIARSRRVETSMEVRSPATGIVLARNVAPMQKFEKGDELFQVADLRRVWIQADVFENEASHVRPGTMARVSLPHQGKVFHAKVTKVPPRFDPATRSLKVRLEADNPDIELRPEMFVDVELMITFAPAVNVPVDAVLDSGRRKTVFVDIGNGYFEPRTVETGKRFGDRVEIVEGLMPGEKIAVSGNFFIDSESRMRLAAAGLFGTPTKDPVCGMEVYPNKAKAEGLTRESEGKTFYFCSSECMDQFGKEDAHLAEPPASKDGAQPSTSALQTEAAKYGFAMDLVCGMPVLKRKAKAAGLEIEHEGKHYYFCSGQCKRQFSQAPARYAEKAFRAGQQAVRK
jgi:YHS domain-containing protein/multidrug efflux pump subunit AcrA (membrane-fusion protein)